MNYFYLSKVILEPTLVKIFLLKKIKIKDILD